MTMFGTNGRRRKSGAQKVASTGAIAAFGAACLLGVTAFAPVWSVAQEPQKSVELPSIASNFTISDELVLAGGNGSIPKSAAPSKVGAFRFICTAGQIIYDDPIVYPGEPGKSHLHQFFGNTDADAYSTYESLRKSGDSTCENKLNRSAYWMPAMMNGEGKVVKPNFISIYYKRRPQSDPECQRMGKACVPLPRGLRYIFGYNMDIPRAKQDPLAIKFRFNCQGEGAKGGQYKNLPEAAVHCPSGAQIGAVMSAPQCWDGKNLDSKDHRSHMAYASYGSHGYLKCPKTHPYVVPTFTLGAWWTTDDTLDRSGNTDPTLKTWYLASDRMAGMPPQISGSTLHSDWFGAWDDEVMAIWTENCIDKMLNCSGGNLGNGQKMKRFSEFKWKASPRVVDPPQRQAHAAHVH